MTRDLPTFENVRLEAHDDGVVELVLDRPQAMNAVSTAMADDLAAATAHLAADTSVRVVVLTSSSEKAFCVGADLKERNGFSDADLFAQRPRTRAAYTGVLDLPMPVVAAVDGYAFGGGLEIALSADLVVAGDSSQVGLTEVSVGVIPGGGGTQLLTRRVGYATAANLVLRARRVDAATALRLGVVDEVVAAGTARDVALGWAGEIARCSPVGTRNAKKAMRLGADVDLRAGLEIEDACWRATAFSPDRAEGVAAFNEKRAPRWPGLG